MSTTADKQGVGAGGDNPYRSPADGLRGAGPAKKSSLVFGIVAAATGVLTGAGGLGALCAVLLAAVGFDFGPQFSWFGTLLIGAVELTSCVWLLRLAHLELGPRAVSAQQ